MVVGDSHFTLHFGERKTGDDLALKLCQTLFPVVQILLELGHHIGKHKTNHVFFVLVSIPNTKGPVPHSLQKRQVRLFQIQQAPSHDLTSPLEIVDFHLELFVSELFDDIVTHSQLFVCQLHRQPLVRGLGVDLEVKFYRNGSDVAAIKLVLFSLGHDLLDSFGFNDLFRSMAYSDYIIHSPFAVSGIVSEVLLPINRNRNDVSGKPILRRGVIKTSPPVGDGCDVLCIRVERIRPRRHALTGLVT